MPPQPYRISNSSRVTDQLRELPDQAQAEGRLQAALQAARIITRALTWSPLDFGESMGELPFSGSPLRRGIIDPLTVFYAVNQGEHVVFVRGFHLRPQTDGGETGAPEAPPPGTPAGG